MAGHRQQPGTETLGRANSEPDFRPFPSPIRKRLGIVCAGGGVTGAIYEIGALAALEDRLENVSITDFDVFVGVSAGAYISALLANGVTPGVLFRNVTRSAGTRTDIDDLSLFGLNLGEIATRLATAPFTVLDAAWDFYKNRRETTLTDLVQSLGQLLPSGVFHNEGLEAWMQKWLTQGGRTNDFRRLGKTLRLVAVDPLVPVRFTHPEGAAKRLGDDEAGPLRRRGLPTILDQVFRVTLHSRLRYGLTRYRREAPGADILVFEPKPEDLPRFMRNIMRTSGRVRIAEYAYRSTMALLDSDFKRFQRVFAKHGLVLRPACARDLSRVKLHAERVSGRISTRLTASLSALEADLERWTLSAGTRTRS